jgi:hypothetical protein
MIAKGPTSTGCPRARRRANAALTLSDVPDPGAPWEVIWEFALSYGGYEKAGSLPACAEIANSRRNETLDDLRTCLFFEQRRWRHFGEEPDGEDLEYIRELVKQIRDRISVTSRQPPSAR